MVYKKACLILNELRDKGTADTLKVAVAWFRTGASDLGDLLGGSSRDRYPSDA